MDAVLINVKNNMKDETETFEKFGKSTIFDFFFERSLSRLFLYKKYSTNAVFILF